MSQFTKVVGTPSGHWCQVASELQKGRGNSLNDVRGWQWRRRNLGAWPHKPSAVTKNMKHLMSFFGGNTGKLNLYPPRRRAEWSWSTERRKQPREKRKGHIMLWEVTNYGKMLRLCRIWRSGKLGLVYSDLQEGKIWQKSGKSKIRNKNKG